MARSGWVKLHRKALESPALQRFDEMGVWAMLLMRAARGPTTVRFRGRFVPLQRGQLAISMRETAGKGGLNHARLRTVVAMFVAQKMIEVSTVPGSHHSIVTICNYDRFQAQADDDAQPDAQFPRSSRTVSAQTPHTEQEVGESKTPNLVDPESLTTPPVPADAGSGAARAHLWREAKAFVGGPNAGALIGRWCKEYGEGAFFEAYFACLKEAPADPVTRIAGILRERRKRSGGESAAEIALRILEAEEIADGPRH